MKKAVFFDLDGTLLPLHMDAFTAAYFGEIRQSGAIDVLRHPRGMEFFMQSVHYMIREHGHPSNKDAFCCKLEGLSGVRREVFLPVFEDFYRTRFQRVARVTRREPLVQDVMSTLKTKRYILVLATSPIFPKIATDMRMEWAGLHAKDFSCVTTYENCRYAKPSLQYYRELLKKTGLKAGECYMVGNSVEEDLCAARLGFDLFFLTDYCVGKAEEAPPCPSGGYRELLRWAQSLPEAGNAETDGEELAVFV